MVTYVDRQTNKRIDEHTYKHCDCYNFTEISIELVIAKVFIYSVYFIYTYCTWILANNITLETDCIQTKFFAIFIFINCTPF